MPIYIVKEKEYELTDSVMVSMECIGAVALYLLQKCFLTVGISSG